MENAQVVRDFDRERFEELMLYIASRSANDPRFGKTKLAKILFFSDFIAYMELGDSITGAIYSKFPNGPVPKALFSATSRIERCGAGALAVADYFGKDQQRLVALRAPDLSHFTAAEISIVDQVIDALKDDDAAGVSALSHRAPAWQYVNDGEPIPYQLAWVATGEPPEDVVEVAVEAAKDLGLARA